MKHTKFLLAFIVGIFLINLASASIFDAKTFEKNDSMQYGRYVIKEGCIPLTNICFGGTTEIIELKNHPFFVGVQFHPELKSKPFKPHPLFNEFIKSARANSARQK